MITWTCKLGVQCSVADITDSALAQTALLALWPATAENGWDSFSVTTPDKDAELELCKAINAKFATEFRKNCADNAIKTAQKIVDPILPISQWRVGTQFHAGGGPIKYVPAGGATSKDWTIPYKPGTPAASTYLTFSFTK